MSRGTLSSRQLSSVYMRRSMQFFYLADLISKRAADRTNSSQTCKFFVIPSGR